MAKRTLHDLYVVGKELTIDDGDGGVDVWMQKISPAEHDKCINSANAERARVMLALRDETSDEYLAILADTLDHSREVLLDYLLVEDEAKIGLSIEAELELAEGSEWGTDGYLQGLRDLWNDRLKDQWADDEDDPESNRVLNELRRFAAEVDTRLADAIADVRAAYDGLPDDELRRRTVDTFVEQKASQVWLTEYHRSRIYFATRRPENHRAYLLGGRPDVDTLPEEVRKTLLDTYEAIEVAAAEGKESRRATPSSPSPDSPGALETAQSSGPATSHA